jgi:glycosyltransferase involved in cell wall biosynthesis
MKPQLSRLRGAMKEVSVLADAGSAPVAPEPIRLVSSLPRPPAATFVLLCFEGPDSYCRAGGLSARVSGLACALAAEGYETHLFFIGAPELPGHEVSGGGRLHLHRWCQWISHYHPGGVYDGEEGKLYDWNDSLPAWLERELMPGLAARGEPVVVVGEEWHTSQTIAILSRRARERGWDNLRFYWNANNTFGFDRIAWYELADAATITTVSRFMKHKMWACGVDARVIPNGIAGEWLTPCDRTAVSALRRIADGRLLLSKVARWDPNKRWLMAVDAVGALKARGVQTLFVARGGIEDHGREVLERARSSGLSVSRIACEDQSAGALCRAMRNAPSGDILFVESPLSRHQLQCLYRASDGVLANSGIEPFGLVGLEAMASGGVSFLGATGEDYATPGHDAVSLQTADPGELVERLLYLREHPEVAVRLRHEARRTAARYTWPQVIRTHIAPMLSLPLHATA